MSRPASATTTAQKGFTLTELLISVALAGLMIAALSGIVERTFGVYSSVNSQNDLQSEARFAMQRMIMAVAGSERLILPLPDNPKTNWPEHIREQTVPASPPIGSSTFATAVLAVTLDPGFDLDRDGTPDADNDADGLIDEDPGGDLSWDLASGIFGIDDDGDGAVDELHSGGGLDGEDDDEDGTANEDGWNGVDDDKDSAYDEDPSKDMNGDNLAGIGGVDDDGDSSIDEGDQNDDDEDGSIDEDWFDPVVFYLSGTTLIERRAVPWDEDISGTVTGRDFVEGPIADNVSLFRVERLPQSVGSTQLVDITIELTTATGATSLQSRVRLGARL